MKNILVVEDDEGFNTLMQKALKRAGFQTAGALNARDAIARMHVDGADMMLLDYVLPDMTGKDVILNLAEENVHTPFIMVTGHGDEKIAVEMMKLGARDYVIKTSGFIDVLPQVVKRVVRELDREDKLEKAEEALRTENRQSREELQKRVKELKDFYEMAVGREVKMKEIKEEIQRLKTENEAPKNGL